MKTKQPENEPWDNTENGGEPALDTRLAALLAELPREIEPARDLWPGIAARLELPAAQPSPPRPGVPTWWRLAAAGVAGAALGAALTFQVLSGPGPAASAGVAPPPNYRLIEADYLRAREVLWLAVYARGDRFSPDTLAAVEKSFASLDRAIHDLRRALEHEPGNPRLEAELYRSHRRSLGLLRKLADHT